MISNAKRGKQVVQKDLPPDKPLVGHYVILKPMTFPMGLFGAYSVGFHLPDGVPLPKGDPGHSTITLSNGYCLGCSY